MEEVLKKFISEFEKYLGFNLYKKYQISNQQYVYDIEKTDIISILVREENQRQHIIVEEIFSNKKQNFKIKGFCGRYVECWVSYFPFYNKLGQDNPFLGEPQYKKVNQEIPELNIDKRFEEWKGFYTCYAGFELDSGEKRGYALAKYSAIGGINELREISKYLIKAYIDGIENNRYINEEYMQGISNFKFIFDRNMCEILKERYFTKFQMQPCEFKIFDMQAFWTSECVKDENDDYKVLDNLKKNKFKNTGVIGELYTENMQKYMPKLEGLNDDHFYLTVEFPTLDIYSYNDGYNYLSDDASIKYGDKVFVNFNGTEIVGIVTNAKFYKVYNAPFPVARTKKIIKKIESGEELIKLGFEPKDFEDYYDDNDEDFEPDYIYYIITTFTDNKEIANNIRSKLINKKLVASVHVSTIESSYWWNNDITSTIEYKIEIRTRDDKICKVEKEIKEIHNYELAEIDRDILNTTEEIKNWIDDCLKIEN